MKLLTRNEFRSSVFARDLNKCVNCGNEAQDAHHLIERRLFVDGGYYLDNGVSLCGPCHILAETTELSVETLRLKAKIGTIILPDHLYKDAKYTKWGDIILNNGTRVPGELFNDPSVQKILAQGNILNLYTHLIKYPRTYHAPWSGYIGKDDKIQNDLSLFNEEIVVTAKLDGENTSMYNDYIHARSLDGNSHFTQSWVRNFHNKIAHNIPNRWRICGENMFARHSISYDNLESYFYLFSIWNEKNNCLSWDETCEYAQLLEIPTVPVIYRGVWSDKPEKLHSFIWKGVDESKNEGYVIRSANDFPYSEFRFKTMKYVRVNHVTTASHWKFNKIEKNLLKE